MPAHRTAKDLAKTDPYLDPGDAGNIAVDHSPAIVELVTGAAGQTRSLKDPLKGGQILILTFKTDGGGDCTVTADTAINVAGNTIMTFADQFDTISLVSIPDGSGGFRYSLFGNDGPVSVS